MNIFDPEKPNDNFSNILGALVAIIGVFVIIVVFFLLYSTKLPERISRASLVLDAVSIQKEEIGANAAGGDVIVAPPAEKRPKLPKLIGEMPPEENFSADSVFVKDNITGMVLFRKNEYEKRPIASITKLMSALVILEKRPDWSSAAQVVPDNVVDTHMYAGDTYTLDELWHAFLIGSSNKAALTLADAVGWPREAFIERMNQKARELGMADTFFADPTGLDPKNISSASDLVLLLDEAMRSKKIRESVLMPEYNLYSKERNKSYHMWNTNWLLLNWIPHNFFDLRGGKTGYIPESGYNFVMRVSDDSGHLIDVVILGAKSHEARFTEARDAAEWAFKSYVWPPEDE